MGLIQSFFSKKTNDSPCLVPVSSVQERVVLDTSTSSVVTKEISSMACFGAGCYWGTEKYFTRDFPGFRSIVSGQVGFMGPSTAQSNPSYEEVCRGTTGHVEVYCFEFTNGADTYEELVKFFFQFHDPTTPDRQGNDKGTQYASVIYAYDRIQYEIAQKVKAELQSHLDNGVVTAYTGKVVSTDIRMSTLFYPAHKEHQQYLENNPRGYCNHKIRFKKWPS